MAVDVPDFITKFTPCRVSGYDLGGVGYLKWIPLNNIFFYILIFSLTSNKESSILD